MHRPILRRSTAVTALCFGLACGPLAAPEGGQHVARVGSGSVQPALLRLAAARADTPVRVIVQVQGPTAAIRAAIAGGHGHITRELTLIHALAATLPARAIPLLARSPGVRYVSPDAVVTQSDYVCCSTAKLQSVYPQAIGASELWGSNTGQGIGVAVVDSGVRSFDDGETHIVAHASANSAYPAGVDAYGHGTHVAGIIGGNGVSSNGAYIGIAPRANIVDVRVANDQGMSTLSDVVNGLQWVYNNKATYNIRVVNLSLNSTVADSYQVDPLDAAVETLWKGGIVVVVSAGNAGATNAGVMYAPANDPFVITVGAVDDHGTASTSDDTLASFSSYGTVPVSTTAGQTTTMSKPDLVAPGVNIVSDLASTSATLATAHPDHVVSANTCTCYFRMSGTSMAAPMVAGAVALLLQSTPNLTPDQVKYRLVSTAQPLSAKTGVGAGEVNMATAVASTSTASANQNLAVAASLQPGNPAAQWSSASWGSASWGSTSWGSASWGSASWGSASWGSASWGSDYWGP